MYDLIIRDATIVSSKGRQVADVAIKDGRIAYVGPRPPRRAKKELSAIGKFLMPGVIDTAVQFDPSGTGEAWARESKAAVTGGVTTVLSLPGGERPVVDRLSAKRRAKAAGKSSWCNWGLWAEARHDNREELDEAIREGLVIGALAYIRGETEGLTAHNLEAWLDMPGVLGVQIDMTQQTTDAQNMLAAAKSSGKNIHLIHLSTAEELNLIDPVHGTLPVTTGCTPHHLFLSTDESDTIRTTPPVRPEHDRRTLWAAVKRGRLDLVASDHHLASKSGEGVPGAELLFPLMLSAVKYGRLSLELLVSLCAESPARIFGLNQKGRVEKGADADLVLFSEGEVARVDQGSLVSGAGWSPYSNREAAPKPDLVIVNGQIVAERGVFVGQRPNGRPVFEA